MESTKIEHDMAPAYILSLPSNTFYLIHFISPTRIFCVSNCCAHFFSVFSLPSFHLFNLYLFSASLISSSLLPVNLVVSYWDSECSMKTTSRRRPHLTVTGTSTCSAKSVHSSFWPWFYNSWSVLTSLGGMWLVLPIEYKWNCYRLLPGQRVKK